MNLNCINKQLVSKSDLLRNYNSCKEKIDEYGEVIVLTNNKPDAVMMDVERYEMLLKAYKQLNEYIDHKSIYNMVQERKNAKEKTSMEDVFKMVGLEE